MKLNHLQKCRLAVAVGVAALALCAAKAKADGTNGFYLGSDAGINFLESFRHVSTEPGWRWGVEGGYELGIAPQLTLGAELESGFIYNSIRSGKHDGEDDQIPLLGNLILKYHLDKWVPYIGAGVGGDSVGISAGHSVSYYNIDLAAQLQAGVRYELTPNFDVGVGYKYFVDLTDRNVQLSNNAFLLAATCHF